MAFLTSQRGSGTPNVAKAFVNADQAAIGIKLSAIAARDKAQAGSVTAYDLLDGLLGNLVRGKAILVAASDVDGIATYASDQYADVVGYNVATEFTSLMSEINATITFLVDNHPKDADGNLKHISVNASGVLSYYGAYTVNQRNAIVSRLNALIAVID